jgi:murein DD-endopeptidase MepM/ murein hydrolase activator NlpD
VSRKNLIGNPPARPASSLAGSHSGPGILLSGLMWFIAVLMVALLAWVISQRAGTVFSSAGGNQVEEAALNLSTDSKAEVPEFHQESDLAWISRIANTHTILPEKKREAITDYVVEAGDSVFSIAKKYDLKPETILWANEDLLQDNPNDLSVGQKLKIPAEDGVIYKWKKNDTIESIARKFKTDPERILTWPDNNLDLANPKIASGTLVMVPGGSRELRTWVVPTYWRANAGATRGINAGCNTSGGTAVGTGTFVWPTSSHLISGNDFWSGHLGIDIGAAMGAPVYAADSGVVVYAAGIGGGYGLMVMIDHGNGFHTLYAHLSTIIARCGSNVFQGQTIAYSGSTGNSTGPHLHFEIRYGGAFVNPHDYVQ